MRGVPTAAVCRVAVVVAVAAAFLTTGAALAQTSPPQAPQAPQTHEADAASTFDYGLSEMLATRYATGCPAIEASFRLDPRPGTLFTLADCERKWGKTASALARFDEYLALYDHMPPDQHAKQRERAGVAATERAALERSVPLLALRLPNDAPPGTRVWRDDLELAPASLGAAVPVDPGEHVVRAQVGGAGRSVEQRVTLASGEQRTLVIDLTAATPPPPAIAPPPVATIPPPVAPETTTAPAPSAPSSHRGWIYVAGGVALASFAVAGVTGGWALAEKGETSPACDALGRCVAASAVNAGNEARTLANVETGAFIVGGVALAVALVAWATEPSGQGAPSGKSARASRLTWSKAGVGVAW